MQYLNHLTYLFCHITEFWKHLIMFPLPNGAGGGGHLDLLWFPVTWMRVGVHPSVRIHLCQIKCLRIISYSSFADGFQILRYGDHRQDL